MEIVLTLWSFFVALVFFRLGRGARDASDAQLRGLIASMGRAVTDSRAAAARQAAEAKTGWGGR